MSVVRIRAWALQNPLLERVLFFRVGAGSTWVASVADNGPKRHHYVPAGYLSAFATPAERDGRLWTADLENSLRVFPTTPNDAGVQRAYYRVDVAGVHPNAIEDEFAKIEDEALPIIREAARTGAIPDGRPHHVGLGFVAMLATRGPHFRGMHSKLMSDVAGQLAGLATAAEETFESQKADMLERGHDVAGLTQHDLLELQSALASGEARVEQDRTTLTMLQLRLAAKIADVLLHRQWRVRRVIAGARELVSSDNPVTLRPTLGNRLAPLGFGLPSAEVILPLSPTALLVGRLGIAPSKADVADSEVLAVNRLLAQACTRWVYARRNEFEWLGRLGRS